MPSLSIVVPCYNEEQTLRVCVDRILGIVEPGLDLEIVIVDDCSKDASRRIAKEIAQEHCEVKVLHHDVNQGKGAALRTGFQAASKEYVAVQDADLEYNPQELKKLLVPLVDGDADVVVGSRFLSGGSHRVLYFWHSMGNKFLTLLSNMFTNLNLTDMETCYKVFRREVIQSVPVEENRFGFEPEIIAKVAARNLRIFEMGISYHGRTYDEGKKIGWRDGFRALFCILRYNAHNRAPTVQALYQLSAGGAALIVSGLLCAIAALVHLPGLFAAAAVAIGTLAVSILLITPYLSAATARGVLTVSLLLTAGIAAGVESVAYSATPLVWGIGAAVAWKSAQRRL